jgi:organic radical activating enzyme
MAEGRQIAFGYSTQCNISCGHCVSSGASHRNGKMSLERAEAIIEDMAFCHVTGISFTAGEPFLFFDDMIRLVKLCHERGIYSRVVTNGFWANIPERSDNIVSGLMGCGLSQLRISCSRWHQKHIPYENIVNAASSCQRVGLDYFISFVTDFSKQDDSLEQFLRDNRLKFFPEPVIYFGRAKTLNPERIFTDYQPNICPMNPYLSPDLDMFACCDGGNRFTETDFLYLGNLEDHPIDALFRKKEENILYNLIGSMGLTNIASFLGFKASDIVQYRRCELCERLFNSAENLNTLNESAESDLFHWRR